MEPSQEEQYRGAIVATTGNTALASYAGTAAGSATEEIISVYMGEKELNWDNIKQSAVTVARYRNRRNNWYCD
ncbi:MAG: hypothetical protein ACLTE2_05350 [Eubacteriales bacterium]